MRSTRSERGAALVEAAVVMPFLLFVIIGIVSIGQLLSQHLFMSNALRVATRVASTYTENCLERGTRVYETEMHSAGLPGSGVTAVYEDGSSGLRHLTLRASLESPCFVCRFLTASGTLTMTGEFTMPLENENSSCSTRWP